MNMELLQHSNLTLALICLLSLCIGSFLNVVISRLPAILEEQKQDLKYSLTKTNLLTTSCCPCCNNKIKPWHNIPILSFVYLKGKCAYCKKSISYQYPAVEVASALGVLFILLFFGINSQSLLLCIMYFFLLSMSIIDIKHFILPDQMTISLMWLGLFINIKSIFCSTSEAILGAIVGYIIFWIFYWVFKLVTKKEGFGYGDFKLTASIGAWLGIQALPFVIILSTLTGIAIALLASIIKKKKYNMIPFGPAIAIAALAYPFVGEQVMNMYIQWAFNI